jgi:hypothetical protein
MQQNAEAFSCRLRVSAAKKISSYSGAMDGEEGTTKYAKFEVKSDFRCLSRNEWY